jgi:DNA-binding Xre family transcriptional regulator
MPQRTLLVGELKRLLKERGINYSAVARKLKLSHASVKRLFSQADFTLQRIDEVCELAGLEISDLVERMQQREAPASKMTLEQEREIVSDPRLLLMTWLALNKWRFDDIVKFYDFSQQEALKYLLKLDRLKLIELQPGNRVRLLVSRNISWRRDGPMHRFLHQVLLKEFFASDFSDPRSEFSFYAAEMSESVIAKIKRAIQNTLKECVEMSRQDANLPVSQRHSTACVLALRPWQYTGFDRFRKEKR